MRKSVVASALVLCSLGAPAAVAYAEEAAPPTTIDVQTPAEREAEANFDNDDDSDNTGLWGLLGLLGLIGLAGLAGRRRDTTTDVGVAARPTGTAKTNVGTGTAARPTDTTH